jgi:hypothetical protein
MGKPAPKVQGHYFSFECPKKSAGISIKQDEANSKEMRKILYKV